MERFNTNNWQDLGLLSPSPSARQVPGKNSSSILFWKCLLLQSPSEPAEQERSAMRLRLAVNWTQVETYRRLKCLLNTSTAVYYFHSSALVGWPGSQLWSGLPSPPVSGMSPHWRIFNSIDIGGGGFRETILPARCILELGKFQKGWEFAGKWHEQILCPGVCHFKVSWILMPCHHLCDKISNSRLLGSFWLTIPGTSFFPFPPFLFGCYSLVVQSVSQ